MKVAEVFVSNSSVGILLGDGTHNRYGTKLGTVLSVGKTEDFLNFSCEKGAIGPNIHDKLDVPSGASVFGLDISTIGVGTDERLVFISTEGERKDYTLSYRTEPQGSGQSKAIYAFTEIQPKDEFETIWDHRKGYKPRRVTVPNALAGFIFNELKNGDDFNTKELFKLQKPDGTVYVSSGYHDLRNRLRPSLDKDPREAYNQVWVLLSLTCPRHGHWVTLQMIESPGGNKAWIFGMLLQAFNEVLEEMVEKGYAEERESLLYMKRWTINPPRDFEGMSTCHDVLIGDFAVAQSSH